MRKLIPFSFLFLIACSTQETSEDLTEDAVEEEVYEEELVTEEFEATEELTFDPALAELPETYPSEKYRADLMQESTYHEGEIPENTEDKEWWGLFQIEGNRYSLERAIVTVKPIHDPMLDNEGEMSGREVSTVNEGESAILISGLDNLETRTLTAVTLESNEFYPETPCEFSQGGKSYRVFSIAKIEQNTFYTDYHLYIELTDNGEKITQEIARADNFDDAMMYAQFVGDIDGDGIVDFLIETSRKYSMSSPTLFLSTAAEEGQIYGRVGEIASVGC